jgi:hypothetical protein
MKEKMLQKKSEVKMEKGKFFFFISKEKVERY